MGPRRAHTRFFSRPLALELLDPTFYNVLRRERVSASVGVFGRLIDMLLVERPAGGRRAATVGREPDRLEEPAVSARLGLNR